MLPMSASSFVRREFLSKCGRFGFATGIAVVHASCSGGEASTLTCTDTSGMVSDEIKARDALQYVDRSPDPSKTCKNCQLFEEPAAPGRCGGCSLAKGPYHPDGYCISWVGLIS